MQTTLRSKKRRYQVDLSALQAQCAANYARMMKLFPHMCEGGRCDFVVGSDHEVVLEVAEQGPYTTLVNFQQAHVGNPLLGSIKGQLRVYHDAGMVDVVDLAGQRRVAARNPYPNSAMLQEDEKWQRNRFIGDWLEFCLAQGHAILTRTTC